jgi:Tfp pilus assembly protein PilN
MKPLEWLKKAIYFLLEYLGIIEIVFYIKSPQIITVIFLNYLFGKKVIQISEGQIIDPLRLEFSLERFIEKHSKIPILIANLILPQETIVNKVITVPEIDKRKLKNVIISYLEGIGIFDINSLSFNYQVVGKIKQKGRNMLKIFISATKQNVINDYISVFKATGMALKKVVSSTIPLINLFRTIESPNATLFVFGKEEEIFIVALQGKDILRLEVIENIDKAVIQRYVIGVVTDIVKERTVFLEKILFFNIDYEIIENVFEATNIICLPGEQFLKKELFKHPLNVTEILGFIENTKFPLNLLPQGYTNSINFDITAVRVSFCLLTLALIGGIFMLTSIGDIEKQKRMNEFLSSPTEENVPEEIKRYITVIETKKQIEFYTKEIENFYSKFKNMRKTSEILYDIFSSIDTKTWLKEVKLFPEAINITGYSLTTESFNNTIKNISSISYIKKVIINSMDDQKTSGKELIKFDLEIEL